LWLCHYVVHYMERTSAFRIGLASGARLYDMDVICFNFSLVVKAISITFYPSFFLLSPSPSLSLLVARLLFPPCSATSLIGLARVVPCVVRPYILSLITIFSFNIVDTPSRVCTIYHDAPSPHETHNPSPPTRFTTFV
jgi:hypothetical protein